jgi:zinc transport system substrate-binding protein
MKLRLVFNIAISVIILVHLPLHTEADRLRVVASVFPLYDFAREIAGTDADVRMLLPAGVEPHSWEPKPSDIVAVSKSDIFLYVSEAMEPWAHSLVSAVAGRDVAMVEVMDRLGLQGTGSSYEHGKIEDGPVGIEGDPHFWLDLSLSARAVEMIGNLLAEEDPGSGGRYAARAQAYTRRLEELDRAFSKGLKNCRIRKFVTGGHSAFGHLAKRYDLEQISLYGVSPDSEPTPAHLASVSVIMKKENLDVVFFEEMVNPRLARVLASEVGASTTVLTPAGNLTAERINQGITFIQIMEENLQNLRKGLYCE